MHSLVNFLVLALGLHIFPALVAADTTVIPSNSFSSVSTFESFWNYLYPWGSDHNGMNSWPPETDIGEWKGTNDNWFNTFNTSSVVRSDLVAWPADLSFHSLKAVLKPEPNGADVRIDFFMDNALRATQFGKGFVGKALWLIINLQMEGSSGSPGPTGTTTYKARNVVVTRND
ncbi:hypothetical protein EYR38_006305 [Pleurotus pulmonarius]|nr:hypothetical protein EYR38_006305 [Pleurotus pulmonarius]